MSSNTRDNILLFIIIVIFLWIGGEELWGFDRSATPTYKATWSLEDTTPELVPLPKSKMRPNRVYNDTQLRLYEETNEVVLFCPGTNLAFVIPCENISIAKYVYSIFSVRYTYYIAADRTYTNHKGNNDEVAAAETFLDVYLYPRIQTINEPMYGNRYIDQLTYEINPNNFIMLVNSFDPNSPFIKHEYKTDIYEMWEEIKNVYTIDTILAKHWVIDE
jgi:hypothetical protein